MHRKIHIQKAFLRAVLLFLFSYSSFEVAQEKPFTLKVDVPIVSVDVAVTDAKGNSVKSLAVGDFELLEDGVPQEIRYFSPISAAYTVLLLFDQSGSTEHEWSFMQRAASGFLTALRPQDRIAVGTFDYELQMQVRWSDSRTYAANRIRNLQRRKFGVGTEFFKVLELVLRKDLHDIAGRRAIVVLTDGRDTDFYRSILVTKNVPEISQDLTFQKTLLTVRELGIPIHFVALNTDRNLELNPVGVDEYRDLKALFRNSPLPELYLSQVRSGMEQLAEASGGRILFPKMIEDVVPLYEQIGKELGMSYTLEYLPGNKTEDGSTRRIEVKVRRNGVNVTQSRVAYDPK